MDEVRASIDVSMRNRDSVEPESASDQRGKTIPDPVLVSIIVDMVEDAMAEKQKRQEAARSEPDQGAP